MPRVGTRVGKKIPKRCFDAHCVQKGVSRCIV